MPDIFQGTDKEGTSYTLLALSIRIHPLPCASWVSGARRLTATFLRLPCCQGSRRLLADVEDETQLEATLFLRPRQVPAEATFCRPTDFVAHCQVASVVHVGQL